MKLSDTTGNAPALRPFQLTGVDFLASRVNALLLDDAGLGKSAQVLAAADKIGAKRILIIGPAVAGVSWPGQVAQWAPHRKFYRVAEFDLPFTGIAVSSSPGVFFVSYDYLSMKANARVVAALRACDTWDVLVLDEGQYLKNPGANRTQAIYGTGIGNRFDAIETNAARVWVLSGTLTPNHAGEAFTHLRALFPDHLKSIPAFKNRVPEQYEFENEFCVVADTVFGRAIQGSKNQGVLRAALAPVLLRRKKQDVLTELPSMEWLTAPIEADAKAVQDIYAQAGRDAGLGAFDFDAMLENDPVATLAALFPNGSRHRYALGRAKVAGCAAWVRERLVAGDPKVIVFAHHTLVIDELMEALLDFDPVRFDGGTGPINRKLAVELFQTSPNRRVFVGQLQAAGTAITLTAARTVFFAEYAGTPGVNYQAASRAHRMGQREGVQVFFGTVPGSLDERIAATAQRRAREIAELFD